MSGVLDHLCRLLQAQPPPPPPRRPAGSVTPILRTRLPDVTDPDYLAGMVASPGVTEAEIEQGLHRALLAQAMQDDLVETEDGIVGLRACDVRPLRPEAPATTPPPPEAHPDPLVQPSDA